MQLKVKNFNVNNYMPRKFQEGGPVEAPAAEAPVEAAPEQGGNDPMMQIQAFQQGLETQDCQLLAQAAQAFLQAVGGGAEQAPAAPEGQPVYRQGGKLSRWID